MSLRAQLIADGFTQDESGNWVKKLDGVVTSVTYSAGVVTADDAMVESRARTGKRWFNVYTGPVMCGPEDEVIEVDLDATEEFIKNAIRGCFGDRVWKVYEVDESGDYEIRMW